MSSSLCPPQNHQGLTERSRYVGDPVKGRVQDHCSGPVWSMSLVKSSARPGWLVVGGCVIALALDHGLERGLGAEVSAGLTDRLEAAVELAEISPGPVAGVTLCLVDHVADAGIPSSASLTVVN